MRPSCCVTHAANACSVSEPAGVYSLMDCASRPNAGFTHIKLLVGCILLLGSCSRSNLEVTPDNFIDRIIGLGERDNLFDPADVSRFLGVKFEQDMTPPMAESSSVLFLPTGQSPLSKTNLRLSMDRSRTSSDPGAALVIVDASKFFCISRTAFVQKMNNKQFPRRPGYNPMQWGWDISDQKDRRTAILLSGNDDQNGCIGSLILSTVFKY